MVKIVEDKTDIVDKLDAYLDKKGYSENEKIIIAKSLFDLCWEEAFGYEEGEEDSTIIDEIEDTEIEEETSATQEEEPEEEDEPNIMPVKVKKVSAKVKDGDKKTDK